jgi:hypothetical protein
MGLVSLKQSGSGICFCGQPFVIYIMDDVLDMPGLEGAQGVWPEKNSLYPECKSQSLHPLTYFNIGLTFLL